MYIEYNWDYNYNFVSTRQTLYNELKYFERKSSDQPELIPLSFFYSHCLVKFSISPF